MPKKKTYNRMMLRSVRGTMSRFLAILCIVALGTGFLCGLLSTQPDMRTGIDKYFDDQNAMDLLIQGTQGITDSNVEALRNDSHIEAAQGKYSLDMLIRDSGDESYVTRVIGEDFSDDSSVNRIQLMEGRLPEEAGECVIEIPNIYVYEIPLGETLVIDPQNRDYEDLRDSLKQDSFRVVGIARSPQFIHMYGDASTVGDGTMVMAMYVSEDDLDMEYYTAVYATVSGAKELEIYTDPYDELIEAATDDLEALGKQQAKLRTEEIRSDALEEYNDGVRDFEKEKADAYAELDEAKAEIDDGQKKIDEGWDKIADGRSELEDAKDELADGKAQIEDAKAKLENGRSQIADGRKEIKDNKDKINDGLDEIEEGRKQIVEGREEIDAAQEEIDKHVAELAEGRKQAASAREEITEGRKRIKEGRAQLDEGKAQAEEGRAKLEENDALLSAKEAELAEASAGVEALKQARDNGMELTEEQLLMIESYDEGIAQAAAAREQLDEAFRELEAQETQISVSEEELAAKEKELDDAEAELDTREAEMDTAEKELSDGQKEIDKQVSDLDKAEDELDTKEKEAKAGLKEIRSAEKELEDKEAELISGEKELKSQQKKIKDAEQEISDGEKELEDNEATLKEKEQDLKEARKDYEDARAEADEKIADAEAELADAKAEIDDIEEGKWIIRDRSDNMGMSNYKDDSAKIGAIAKVFPVFFFVIAALVALTTLTRLVEEERDRIGALKSLGYSSGDVRRYYMLYGLAASVLGCLIGIPAGCVFFPKVISNAYDMMYVLPNIATPVLLKVALPVASGLTLMILIATWFSVREVLKEKPAALLLPRAPKAGKRILMERIGFIWNRLSFSRKVTLRNIFRYKKRFLMTIIGVAGCFALLLTGFGIRDSIGNIVELQYGEIMHFDYTAQIEDHEAMEDEDLSSLLKDPDLVSEYFLCSESPVTLTFNGKKESSNFLIPEDPASLGGFITLRGRSSHKAVPFGQGSLVLTEKSANNLGADPGDTITVQTEDGARFDAVITGLTENYVGSHLYISPDDYRELTGQEPEYTSIYLKSGSGGADSVLAEKLLGCEDVLYIVDTQTVKDNFAKSVKSIDYIIMVLIVASGALAIIVLYNLTNVNICERKKELATIRVLGFYHREVSAYIFREVDILALIGILVGIPIGIWLHHYIIITVEVAGVMFGRTIHWSSYLIAAGFTILFTVFVNLIMRRTIRKIDMVESMKAVD